MVATTEKNQAIAKVAELIKGIKYTMLTTVGADGKLYSRPMTTQEEDFDGTVWFFTYNDNSLSSDVEHQQDISLSYAEPSKNRYVSITGAGHITTDRSKMEKLWKPALKAWFPDGLETPNIALLKVQVEKAEYWDSPSSAIVQVIGFAKAVLTGQSYQPGEHERLKLQ